VNGDQPTTTQADDTDSASPTARIPGSRTAIVAALTASIVAAVVATFAVNGTQDAIQIPEELATRAGEVNAISLPPDLQAEVDEADYQVRLANNGLAFGVIGATFAACFGLAFGIARRSVGAGLLAVGIGTLAGGVMGGIGGVLAQLFDEHFQVREKMDAFLLVLVMHAIALSFVATATAIAVAIGSKQVNQIVKLVATAVISVTIAVALFLIVAPLVSIARTNLPVPEGIVNQAIWLSLLAGLLGFTFYRHVPK
jgi:hypothetical protein